MQLDCLSELEASLAQFTDKLASSIGQVKSQAAMLNPQERARLVSALGGEIASAHRQVISAIDKIPQDVLGLSRKELENQIHELQLQYQTAVQKLSSVQEAAKTAYSALEAAIASIEDN
mmetsp:Transcript_14071/g.26354  ORF Transcript_14071/g.26354 Transcript_14071/m.26354 type:complete len:119 (-) Transcript_14071:189-545(-)